MFGRNNYMPYASNMFMNPGMMGGGMYSSPMTRGIGGLGRSIGGSSLFGGGRGLGSSALSGGRGLGNALGGASRVGLFGRLRGANWSSIITNTGKTLDVVNRAIPIVKQTGPMFNNMKTMFRLASAFKDESGTNKENTTEKTEKNKKTEEVHHVKKDEVSNITISDNATPSFFI